MRLIYGDNKTNGESKGPKITKWNCLRETLAITVTI